MNLSLTSQFDTIRRCCVDRLNPTVISGHMRRNKSCPLYPK